MFWVKVWIALLVLFLWPVFLGIGYVNALGHHVVHAEHGWSWQTLPLSLVEVYRLNKAIFLFYFGELWEAFCKLDLDILLAFCNVKPLDDFKVM